MRKIKPTLPHLIWFKHDFMDDDTLCDISPINGNLINTLNWSGPYLVLSALLLSLKHLSRNTIHVKTNIYTYDRSCTCKECLHTP